MESFYDRLRINICNILGTVSKEAVHNIIQVIRNAGFNSLVDLQLVQEKDLMSILKPIPRRKLIKEFNKPDMMMKDLVYESEDVRQQMDKFLPDARNSAESTANPVPMEGIAELIKTNICKILNSVSEETLNEIIQALEDAGLESLLDLKLVQEDDLTQVLNPAQRKKLVEAWSQNGILFLFSSGSTVDRVPTLLNHNTIPHSNAKSSLSTNNASCSISDLSMFAQSSSVKSEPMDTLTPLQNQFNMDQTDDSLSSEPPTGVFSHYPIGDKRIPSLQLGRLLFQNCGKWKAKRCLMLLRAYLKYKTELSCSSLEAKNEVWKNIALELHQITKCPLCFKGKARKRCSLDSGSDCMEVIERLRLQYNTYKNETVLSGKMVKFFNTARRAFGTSGNPVIALSSTNFSELPSSESFRSFKWIWKKRLALLRLYTIHKADLSSTNSDEQNTWEKIAQEVGKSPLCDANLCRNQIQDMKQEYERLKYNKPYEWGALQPVFLDEAENAFENIVNPDFFYMESRPEMWVMSKGDRKKLLQVYGKYKAELLLQNFDVEKQIVWGKVSREISKKCRFYYGKRRCCYEINHLKDVYEIFKKRKNLKRSGIPYFFHEARKAFESTEYTGHHGKEKFVEGVTVKKERRGWYEHASI